MEKIINNAGYQHLTEEIFWNLDFDDLKICGQINQSCKQILQNPIFSLNRFEHLSRKNKEKWIHVIRSVESADKGIAIISYLKWKLKKRALEDLQCFTDHKVQKNLKKKINKICRKKRTLADKDVEIV